jgi:ABC-2 type transport system ATP-binding protein
MRRRLDLAMTLMGDPRIVFLDEPTTGLDPEGRRTVWRIVRELVGRGVTILLTTHYLEEADALADRVGLLDHGRLIAEGTPDELKGRIPGGHVRLTFADRAGLEAAAAAFPAFTDDDDPLSLRVPGDGGVDALRVLLGELDRASIPVERLTVHTPDLDDVFLAFTGRADRQEVPR